MMSRQLLPGRLEEVDDLCDVLLRSNKTALDTVLTQPHVVPESPGIYLILSRIHPQLDHGQAIIYAGCAPAGLRYTVNRQMVTFPRRVDGALARWRLDGDLHSRLQVQFVRGPFIAHAQALDHLTSQLGYCPLQNSWIAEDHKAYVGPWGGRHHLPHQALLKNKDIIPHRVPPYDAARLCACLLKSRMWSLEDLRRESHLIPSGPGVYLLYDTFTDRAIFAGSTDDIAYSIQRHTHPVGLDKFLVDLQLCGKLDCLSLRVAPSELVAHRGLRPSQLSECLRQNYNCNPIIS